MKQSWSYSRLNDFELCPRQAFYKHYAPKDEKLPFVQNENSARGSRIHKELELAVQSLLNKGTVDYSKMTPVSVETMQMIVPLVTTAKKAFTEQQLAFTDGWTPGSWYDNTGHTWLRVVLDLVLIYGDTAIVIDYKTGKIKDDIGQLEICALAVMKYWQRVTKVRTMFLFLDHKKRVTADFTSADLEHLDNKYREPCRSSWSSPELHGFHQSNHSRNNFCSPRHQQDRLLAPPPGCADRSPKVSPSHRSGTRTGYPWRRSSAVSRTG